MKTLLIITHTPSVNTKKLADAVYEAANLPDFDIEVVAKPIQKAIAEDVLNADGLILGTLENLGYMSGITKDFFDRCYYDLLDKKQGIPYAVYIRAGHDGTATKNALDTINNGLRWQMVQSAVILNGTWQDAFIEQVKTLAMTMAAGLDAGIY